MSDGSARPRGTSIFSDGPISRTRMVSPENEQRTTAAEKEFFSGAIDSSRPMK